MSNILLESKAHFDAIVGQLEESGHTCGPFVPTVPGVKEAPCTRCKHLLSGYRRGEHAYLLFALSIDAPCPGPQGAASDAP